MRLLKNITRPGDGIPPLTNPQVPYRSNSNCATPWQNGRTERFFGTLKNRWKARAHPPKSWTELTEDLKRFRIWYNYVSPHQYLDGLPPAWLWEVKTKRSSSLPSELVEAWCGALAGLYLRP